MAGMLKEIAPDTTRVGFVFNPKTAPYVNSGYYRGPFGAAAASLAIKLTANPVESPREFEGVLSALGRDRGGGLIVIPDSFNIVHREKSSRWPRTIKSRPSIPTGLRLRKAA